MGITSLCSKINKLLKSRHNLFLSEIRHDLNLFTGKQCAVGEKTIVMGAICKF